MSRRPWRGAIVGFGNVAVHGHLPGWKEQPDFEIVAVADPSPERRDLVQQELPAASVYSELESLLANEDIDFVDIASPPAFHAQAIVAAAAAGKHVLCEKPLTTSTSECAGIFAAVRQHGVLLHTIHNWKHSEAFRLARQIVGRGDLGRLRSIAFDTSRNGCSVTTGENWRVDAAVAGGGILVDHGWHAFYLMLDLAGQAPRAIRASLSKRRFVDASVEDTVECEVEFPSLTGTIRLTWAAAQRQTRWHIRGDAGELTIDDGIATWSGAAGRQQRALATPLSAGSHHPDWFGGVVDEFRAALAHPDAASANATEAALCVRLLENAYLSGRRGGEPLAIDNGPAAGA